MNFAKVMRMRTTLTITSKGQTTLPVMMRKKLGIPRQGGVVQAEFDERRGEIKLTRSLSAEELSARISQYIKPGTKPVRDVDAYYQAHREAGD